MAERERSRSEYRRLTPPQALAAARRWHPEATIEPLWAPIDPPPGQTVERYLDDHAALVETERNDHFAIAESLLPLLTEAGPGPAKPVDPTLVQEGSYYEPAHPLASLRLPETLSAGIKLPDIGVSVKPEGAELAASGISADNRVFWSGFAADSDLIAEPAAGGVEVSAQLRSAESPERIVLDFELPEGAELVEGAEGDPIEIVRDGQPLATVAPPAAWDADGVEVPVSFEVVGSSLAIDIDHRAGDFLYPILLDPPILEDHRYWSTNSALGQRGWRHRPCGPDPYFINALTTLAWGRGLYTHSSGFSTFSTSDCTEWYWKYYFNQSMPDNASVFVYAANFYGFRVSSSRPHCGTVGIDDGHGNWRQTYGVCSDIGHVDTQVCAQAGCPSNPSVTGDNAARMVTTINESSFGNLSLITYLGGALLYVNDLVAPNAELVTHFPTDPAQAELVDSVNRDVVVRGNDPSYGIGIKRFLLNLPGVGTRVRSSSCDGTVINDCDYSSVDSDEGHVLGDSFTINTGDLPEGLHRITYRVEDAVANPSPLGSFYIAVDHAKPELDLGGSLYAHQGEALKSGVYRLDIEARDLGPAGVKSIEVDVDGRQQLYVDESCGPDGCCSLTTADAVENGCNNPAKAEYHFLPDLETPGQHVITVRARDALDHLETRSFPVTVAPTSTDCGRLHVDAQRSVPPTETDACSGPPDPSDLVPSLPPDPTDLVPPQVGTTDRYGCESNFSSAPAAVVWVNDGTSGGPAGAGACASGDWQRTTVETGAGEDPASGAEDPDEVPTGLDLYAIASNNSTGERYIGVSNWESDTNGGNWPCAEAGYSSGTNSGGCLDWEGFGVPAPFIVCGEYHRWDESYSKDGCSLPEDLVIDPPWFAP